MLIRVPVVAASLALLASASAAQVPGDRGVRPSEHRMRVRAEAYAAVQEVMFLWKDAWEKGDLEGVMRYYADDASLRTPDGAVARGEGDVRAAVERWMDGTDHFETSYSDFESDGDLSVMSARYVLVRGEDRYSDAMTVLLTRDGRRWRIRMQVMGSGR